VIDVIAEASGMPDWAASLLQLLKADWSDR